MSAAERIETGSGAASLAATRVPLRRLIAYALIEGPQFFQVEGVLQRQHRHAVPDFAEFGGGSGADQPIGVWYSRDATAGPLHRTPRRPEQRHWHRPG